MYEKFLAVFALCLFVAFLAVLGIWVEGIDIKIVLALTGLLAAYDFWLDAFKGGGKK